MNLNGLLFGIILTINSIGLCDYVPCTPGSGGTLSTMSAYELSISADISQARQTISDFGASDCWSAQYIGNWPDAKRNAIADYLFHTGLDSSNNPKGIGLSLWRYNLGAGSTRQSNISDTWRRADTYYNEAFSDYDWTRCPGQRWFLQAAKQRGVQKFLLFVNSPPINMTKNGNAFCNSTVGTTNLRSDKITAFGTYLADVLKHFNDVEGIPFNFVSPVNEPQWDWNDNGSGIAGQEGCRYSNSDVKSVVTQLYSQLQAKGVTTPIMITEAGGIDYLYGNSASTNGDQIDVFYGTSSSNYIGNKLLNRISGHSYWSDTPTWNLVSKRTSLMNKLNQYPGLEYAMTEYCILGDDGSGTELAGNGRDLGINSALRLARTIHYDLTMVNAVSWQWWLGISGHDYKDGLVYTDKNDLDGNYYHSKMMWAMGNFSRFIRPGMQRINLTRSDNAGPSDTIYGLMSSSYYDSVNKVIVFVFVNWADQSKIVKLNVANLPSGWGVYQWIPYVTSSSGNLTAYQALPAENNANIPPRSIITFVGLATNQQGVVIVNQPQDLFVDPGQTATFQISAQGNDTLHYQWYYSSNGTSFTPGGPDSPTLEIPDVQPVDEAYYYCKVTGPLNYVNSSVVKLTVKRLLGYWRFNGDLSDSSGNGYTAGGTANYVSDGINAMAANYPGGAWNTVWWSENSFNFYTRGFTVNTWIKTTTNWSWMTMISKQDRTAWRGWLMGTNYGKPYISVREAHGNLVSGQNLLDNQWHMVTGIYDETTGILSLYIDGRPDVQAGPAIIPSGANSEPVVLGAETQTGSISYQGLLDEVTVYNYSLSPLQIAHLYTQFKNAPICIQIPPYDLDNNCKVNIRDLGLFAAGWLSANQLDDLLLMAQHWLECNLVPDCL